MMDDCEHGSFFGYFRNFFFSLLNERTEVNNHYILIWKISMSRKKRKERKMKSNWHSSVYYFNKGNASCIAVPLPINMWFICRYYIILTWVILFTSYFLIRFFLLHHLLCSFLLWCFIPLGILTCDVWFMCMYVYMFRMRTCLRDDLI
jgi:hypothetical protein